MYRDLTIACVIPAFNESGAIVRTLQRVPRFVDRIICVDDASLDGTFALARRTGRRGLEVIRHEANRGVGAAIVTGYRRVVALGLDVAVVMAGDGQMDPTDLPALLDPIADRRAGYVKGNRFRAAGVWRAMPPARIAGNIALSLATKLVSGYWHVFDSQCGYTAIDRATLEAIDLGRLFPRYGYPNDLLARLHAAGVSVVDVPVRAIYGPGWRSGIRLRTVVHPILSVLAAAWARRVGVERLGLREPPALEAADEQTARTSS